MNQGSQSGPRCRNCNAADVEPTEACPECGWLSLCPKCGGNNGNHSESCEDRKHCPRCHCSKCQCPTRPSEADTMGNGNKPQWKDCQGEADYARKMEAYLSSRKTALEVQHGGSHYKDQAIQPVEYCQRNKLAFCESSAIKYLTRHSTKGKAEDVKKALHFCQLLLQLEYGVNATVHYEDAQGAN